MVVLKDSGDHDASPHERDKLAHDLQSLCREHLAPYEVPADIRFVEKLPRSALGKLLRRELRDMANHATQEEAV
jgi:acyl-coenzyme A synthetase/AMP-(fatty) acid ligase